MAAKPILNNDIVALSSAVASAIAAARLRMNEIVTAVAAARKRVDDIRSAPIAAADVAMRIDQLISDNAHEVLASSLAMGLSKPDGSYDANASATLAGRFSAFDLLCALSPDLIREGLKREAAAALSDFGAGPVSTGERQTLLATAEHDLLRLEVECELAHRQVEEASGKLLPRPRGADIAIILAPAGELMTALGS
jgi:hypothetical protein